MVEIELERLRKHSAESIKSTGFIFAKNSENFFELVFLITIVEFFVHHHAKFWKLQVSAPVDVHLVYHVLDLGLGRILTRATHRSMKFL